MGLKDIDIKKNYDSADDDIEKDFYNRVLSNSKYYYRLTGFFSSNSFGISSEGLISFIKNNGEMRIVCSPRLSKQDIEILKQHKENQIEIVEQQLLKDLDVMEQIKSNNLFAFGWLLSTGKLEIKIAIIKDSDGNYLSGDEIDNSSIFHIKTGILKDSDNNIITFSGSINETYPGWKSNIESFKTFKNWEPIQRDYCNKDVDDFNMYWYNAKNNVEVLDLPNIVFEKLVANTPKDRNEVFNKLKIYKENEDEYNNGKEKSNGLQLRYYQQEASDNWFNSNKKGLIEMATGTGKTITAIGITRKVMDEEKRLCVIVACPQNSLSLQWKKEFLKFGISFGKAIVADGTNSKKYKDIGNALTEIAMYGRGNMIIYTTHTTACNPNFINTIFSKDDSIKILFIGDETHRLGAPELSKALLDIYDYRIGLSATPSRWYDDYGTKKIYDFYDKTVFEFSIQRALTEINELTGMTYLCQYEYIPIFVDLTLEEKEKYELLTQKIIRTMGQKLTDDEKALKLQMLCAKRADVHKSASGKIDKLRELISKNKNIENAITFVTPNQREDAIQVFREFKIPVHQFTEQEDTAPSSQYGGLSEREYILNNFKNNNYKSLIAITCLDEGIDIPSAHTAIIMASSTNPREYIQRIGRVIRQAPGKKNAKIYDFIVRPVRSKTNTEFADIEKQIFEKELVRVEEISKNAINAIDITMLISKER